MTAFFAFASSSSSEEMERSSPKMSSCVAFSASISLGDFGEPEADFAPLGDPDTDFFFLRPMSDPLSLPLPSECFRFLDASVSDSLSDTPLRSVGSASDPGLLDLDLDRDGDREAAGVLDFARVGLPLFERAGLPDLLLAGEPGDLAGLADLDLGDPAPDFGEAPAPDLGEPDPDLGEPVLDLGLPLPDFGDLAGEPSDLAEADLQKEDEKAPLSLLYGPTCFCSCWTLTHWSPQCCPPACFCPSSPVTFL